MAIWKTGLAIRRCERNPRVSSKIPWLEKGDKESQRSLKEKIKKPKEEPPKIVYFWVFIGRRRKMST